jgi:hypothetical protein
MNDEERHRIMREARETLDRLATMVSSQPRDPPQPNRLDQWRAGVERQEAEFNRARAERQRKADAKAAAEATREWQDYVGREIRTAVRQIGTGLGEILRDALEGVGTALGQRDDRIAKLECELARAQAEHLKLAERVITMSIEHDRERGRIVDLPPLSKGLN